MNESRSKELKMPVWQNIIYLACVAVAPIIITCIELFNSHSTVFQWSFASIGSALITFLIIKNFVLKKQIEKMKLELHDLEHDYSIEVGNPELCLRRWKKYKFILYCYDAIVILMSMLLCYIFITALSDGLIAFKGAALIILASVLLGTVFKAFTYINYGKIKEETTDETKQN